jgi:hypothetical protein
MCSPAAYAKTDISVHDISPEVEIAFRLPHVVLKRPQQEDFSALPLFIIVGQSNVVANGILPLQSLLRQSPSN